MPLDSVDLTYFLGQANFVDRTDLIKQHAPCLAADNDFRARHPSGCPLLVSGATIRRGKIAFM
jgi:hypothetical protein